MNKMTGFCGSESEERRLCAYSIQDVLTSSQHTLHEIPNVAEDDSEAFCNALLACQRFDLDTLKNWLLEGIIWVIKNGTI